MADPLRAETRAEAILAGTSTADERAFAYQALGIVARERGDVSRAVRLLRAGVAESDRGSTRQRRADLQASLGTALAAAGQRTASMQTFDEALTGLRGAPAARVLVRRCAVHRMFGSPGLAYADARRAAAVLHRSGDSLWEARARNNAASALLELGRFTEADREYARAQHLDQIAGQAYDATLTVHSRADCAVRMGDVPRALRLLHEAMERYEALGVVPVDAQRDLAKVYLAAGLYPEATEVADSLARAVMRDRGAANDRADGLADAATTFLVAGDFERALELAGRARTSYRRLGRPDAARSARLLELHARAATGRVSARTAREALELAAAQRDRHGSERLDGLLLAGDLCIRTGLVDEAHTALRAAATEGRRGSALRRAAGYLAAARIARLEGTRARVLRACDLGLDVLDRHRLSLGSTELQARATSHGRELAETAVREVLRHGDGRDLLRWTERWRATVLQTPAVQPADDAADVLDLAALRDVAVRSSEPAADHAALDRQRARLEERIRRRAHARSGDVPAAVPVLGVDEVVAALDDDTALVAVARVDGVAHVVVARRGRVRRFRAGASHEIDRATEFTRFALRSAATGNEATATAMTAALEDQAVRLEELLLGPAVRVLGDGPVVVVPPARLQSIPWDSLPALRDRPVSVSPSASAWLRSCRATRPRRRRVALVTGPRLESAGAEVPQLAQAYEHATVLSDGAASCDATMKALDGAWLGHVAAHGTIRTDNPMFSALELDDGPLTVYDLERLRRAPYRLVLSVCESAVGAATGADELLGLSSALIGLGTAGLLASIVPVNDEATVPFSLTIHERLRAGDDLATALMHARRAAGDDPVARATAYSFLALGAA